MRISQSLSSMVDQFRQVRVLVVGDVMLDRYVQGSVSRISPEAPVPVVRWQREWATPGGAGHVAASIAGLGCKVSLAALVGRDADAEDLTRSLKHAGVSELHFVASEKVKTVTKTRIVAGDFQQLLRLDQDPSVGEWGDAPEQLGQKVISLISECDSLVLTDYEKGVLTESVVSALIQEANRQGKPVVVDPKKADLRVYQGATILTPNALETERAVGRKLGNEDEVNLIAQELRDTCRVETMLVTRGPNGMTGADEKGTFHIPAKVREVADVTGAGDTVVSVLAACLAVKIPLREACEMASIAAGIAVSHPGTYVVTGEELQAALGGQTGKILSWEAAKKRISFEQARGNRVAFTNGCFDLLHAGHLYSLEEARKRADLLVVGLNSDESVRNLKGPERPVILQSDRATMLAALACVDLVVIFDQATPGELIQALQPDVLLKGGDHAASTIVGGEVVRARGGEVISIPRIEGLSTTDIIHKLRETLPPLRAAG